MNESLLGDFHQAQMDELKTIIEKIDALSTAPQSTTQMQSELEYIKAMIANIKFPTQDNSELKQLIRNYSDSQATSTQVVGVDKLIRSCNNNLVDIYDSIDGRIDKVVEYQKGDTKSKTIIHKLDFTSRRVFIGLLSSALIAIGTTLWALDLHREHDKLRANDIKYRYIKMVGGVDDTFIAEIDDYIYNDKSGKILRHIEEKVESYEKTIAEKIRAEEQARLRAQEAAELDSKIKELREK